MAMVAALDWAFGCGGIVAYHDVTRAPFSPATHISVDRLATQLEFLIAEHYHLIPLGELIERRRAGRPLRRCVALTFDDAYRGVLELALPLLRRFGVPATVFVATAFASEGERYWWDRLAWVRARGDSAVVDWLLADELGGSGESPERAREAVIAAHAGRLSAAADAALITLERAVGAVPERSLSEDELGELARSDLIEFGCHTESHRALPALPPDEQRREIARSHDWLAERFPRVRRFLAYPYGLYDRSTMQAAQDAGMDAAFSIEGRAAGPRFDLYACPRIGVAEVNSLRSLQLRLSWITRPIVAWRNGGWHPRMPGVSRLAGQS